MSKHHKGTESPARTRLTPSQREELIRQKTIREVSRLPSFSAVLSLPGGALALPMEQRKDYALLLSRDEPSKVLILCSNTSAASHPVDHHFQTIKRRCEVSGYQTARLIVSREVIRGLGERRDRSRPPESGLAARLESLAAQGARVVRLSLSPSGSFVSAEFDASRPDAAPESLGDAEARALLSEANALLSGQKAAQGVTENGTAYKLAGAAHSDGKGKELAFFFQATAPAPRQPVLTMTPSQELDLEALADCRHGLVIVSSHDGVGLQPVWSFVCHQLAQRHQRPVIVTRDPVTTEGVCVDDLEGALALEPRVLLVLDEPRESEASAICDHVLAGGLAFVFLRAPGPVEALARWDRLSAPHTQSLTSLRGLAHAKSARQLCECSVPLSTATGHHKSIDARTSLRICSKLGVESDLGLRVASSEGCKACGGGTGLPVEVFLSVIPVDSDVMASWMEGGQYHRAWGSFVSAGHDTSDDLLVSAVMEGRICAFSACRLVDSGRPLQGDAQLSAERPKDSPEVRPADNVYHAPFGQSGRRQMD